MGIVVLSATWRSRLSRLVLLIAVGTTIATSAPPRWSVGETEWAELPDRLPTGGLAVRADVRYRAPRGTWPLRIETVLEPGGQPQLMIATQAVFDEQEVHASATDPHSFEVHCASDVCDGIVTVDLHLTGWLVPADADAGLDTGRLGVVAGVRGGEEGGFFFDCGGKDSSTDSEKAPSTLMVDVTIDPLDESLFEDGGVPDAATPLGNTALPPLRALDAGRD